MPLWPIGELVGTEVDTRDTSAIRPEAELDLYGPLTSEIDPLQSFTEY